MIVTVIGVLTEAEDDVHVRRGMQRALPHLLRLWTQTEFDNQPVRVALLSYSPGAYPAADAGPVRDLMPAVSSGVRLAYSMSDETDAERSRFCITSTFSPDWS